MTTLNATEVRAKLYALIDEASTSHPFPHSLQS
ncbi:type II toxin-antitoxin system Phd/YefM family antitoxin [Spongiibacter taiwanensis]|nr:type II toxin-antitoxin system Phd/YefM family antitoxin [Spongiibacter taiwanensis]USA43843.1 type II toxin-antitoxin system Phd/YefM family antitoxin [Spongiibacter taiwanensis]